MTHTHTVGLVFLVNVKTKINSIQFIIYWLRLPMAVLQQSNTQFHVTICHRLHRTWYFYKLYRTRSMCGNAFFIQLVSLFFCQLVSCDQFSALTFPKWQTTCLCNWRLMFMRHIKCIWIIHSLDFLLFSSLHS